LALIILFLASFIYTKKPEPKRGIRLSLTSFSRCLLTESVATGTNVFCSESKASATDVFCTESVATATEISHLYSGEMIAGLSYFPTISLLFNL